MTYKKMYVQNTDSFSHLVDRLIVENLKLADFVRRLEICLEKPRSKERDDEMNNLYAGLRLANESRAAQKNALDKLLSQVMADGEYHVLGEMRTFALPEDVTENDASLRFNNPDTDATEIAEKLLKEKDL